MLRTDGWDGALYAAIERHRAAPFEWGSHDCATLFRDCVVACTGRDPLADLAPWFSAATAVRALRRAGYGSAFDLVRDRFTAVAPAMAGRGDVGFLAARDALSAPAVITGTEAVSRNETGFVIVPAAALAVAFRV